MCLSKAWVNQNEERQLILEDVAFIKVENGNLILKTLFGEQKEIRADIKEVNFLNNEIIPDFRQFMKNTLSLQ